MRGRRIVLGTCPAGGGRTYATLAARLDPSDGVPVVAAIESTDPAFRPGLVASGLLMAFRGLRRGLTRGTDAPSFRHPPRGSHGAVTRPRPIAASTASVRVHTSSFS